MRRILVFVITAVLITLVLPARAEDTSTYTNDTFGFSLDYPIGWEQQIEDDTVLTLTYLEEEMPVIVVAMGETLSEEDRNADPQEVLDKAIKDIQSDLEAQGLSDMEVTDLCETEINGISATKLSIKISFMGLVFMNMDNIIVRNGDNVIFLSYLAEEGAFETHSETWESIKQSFRLTDSTSPAPDSEE